ncbi:MAG: MerR family transcriptional regulator [Nitrospirota bacterium]|nr:MAG: MerR family transcriptional regulator [Nitrospirota bacterium]
MSNQINHTPAYRIKTVASMTGLSTHLIRKWEERYHLVRPQRGPNGYRTFTEDDVQFLLYLKSQLTHGETIGQLAQSGVTQLRQAMRAFSYSCSGIPNQFQLESRKLIESAQNKDYDAIQKTIASWILQLGLEEAMEVILFPLLRLIGELWHQGRISISAENSMSRIVRQQLINALGKNLSAGPERALIACVPGDNHEIAPLTATLLLQKRGWQATYLGPNVSFEVLQVALRRRHADLMIIASTTEPDVQTGRSWIETMAHTFQPQCRVIAGGAGFRAFSALLAQYGITYLKQVKEVMGLDPTTSPSSNLGMLTRS